MCDVKKMSLSGALSLRREQEKLKAKEAEAYENYKALLAESDSFDALDKHNRREAKELMAALAEDEGYAPDPKDSKGLSASKRPRHESVGPTAPQEAESADSTGEPVAGARTPRSLRHADSARLSSSLVWDVAALEGLPSFSFKDGLVSAGGQGSDDGTL
ncbi:hypothetical protein MPH_07237 [Macrophomina phaseolina MS6]|uniref:Uncharacterized protein n=1 Tax=Macrophomina phaseolina (strain MS6) TaxID=1126212 RepID=K2R000_MACPH|nr:hypothetical protein MPH_07237 [Macrophomina phaseolina MS6]